MSVFPGTSEAAAAPLAVGERIGVFNFNIRKFAYDHLCDSVATLDRIRLLSGIEHYYSNLSAVTGINRPRRVQNCESMFESEPASWSDLCLESGGNFHENPGRDNMRFSWFQLHLDSGFQIESRIVVVCLGRSQIICPLEHFYFHSHFFTHNRNPFYF